MTAFWGLLSLWAAEHGARWIATWRGHHTETWRRAAKKPAKNSET